MSFGGSLQIGRSGLLNARTALDTVGNNLANVATPGYHRQDVSLSPANSRRIQQGVFVGQGTRLEAITRQINEALEGRLRSAIADESGSAQRQELLQQLESIGNEFSDSGLSTQLGQFFDTWSELANNPQDSGQRSLVVREGQRLASFIQNLRGQMVTLRSQTDRSAEQAAERVNDLLDQVETLNGKVTLEGGGQGGAGGVMDQRDQVLSELSEYLDISTVSHDNGSVDVFVGSTPIVLNGKSRGVELDTQQEDGENVQKLVVADDKTPLNATAGKLGAMVDFRQNDLEEAIATLDTFAHQLAWQVNRVHSEGQGTALHDEVTGSYKVEDSTLALNDPDAGLDFVPQHGSFRLHVTQSSTGQRNASTIDVDLDGINPGADTTLDDLAAQIDAVANVNASVTADGRLEITTASDDYQISFSDDTSGALAALGINTFFTGKDAQDIAVDSTVVDSPRLIAAAREHIAGDNRGALAIEEVRNQAVDDLDGVSLTEFWNRHVQEYGSRLAEAREQVEAGQVVRENLTKQQQSVSGVNADDEAIDLMRYQQAYQASARFLSTVNQMMQTLLQAV
ncbi:MAG: flagellar hook-associated protein FlgK [Phycisphaeraceae bacterium]